MKLIPFFAAEIDYAHSEDCVLAAIENFLARNSEQLTALRNKKVKSFVLQPVQSSMFFRNSFFPEIYIVPMALQSGCKIDICFVLKKIVRIIIGIYWCLGAAMEIALIYSVISRSIAISPIILLPLLLMLFAYLLSVVFLKAYSNYWLRVIAQIIPYKKKSKLQLQFSAHVQ